MKKLAIIIGHNRKSKGARAVSPVFGHRDEWDLNVAVSRRVKARITSLNAPGWEADSFLRPSALPYEQEIDVTYGRVSAWRADLAVELHFNSDSGKASGTETLYWHTSLVGHEMANTFQARMVALFELPDRGAKERGSEDRGSRSLRAAKCPTLILEPFFGDNQVDCDRANKVGIDAYADVILSSLSNFGP